MHRFDRITWDPNQMNGQPCIRGMRLTVCRVVEAVATCPNRDDLFRNYPELEPDDVQQALALRRPTLKTALPVQTGRSESQPDASDPGPGHPADAALLL